MIDRDLAKLFPAFAADLTRFVKAWNLNHPDHPVQVFEGLRTHGRQAELYAQGRTAPGPIVTNAAPGTSWHNFGLAADVVFDADATKPGAQWTWDGKLPWPMLGAMAQGMGFEWAGAWKRFPEYPHVQKTYGLTLNEAQELYRGGGLAAVWKEI